MVKMSDKFFCPKCGGWSGYNFDVISKHENWYQEVVKCRTCKWIGAWSETKKIDVGDL